MVDASATFNSTTIPITSNTSIAVLANEELYNLRYNQNFYQRINIGSNPASAGTSTFTVGSCVTAINDATLTTSAGDGSRFDDLCEVGQGISGQYIPDGTTILSIATGGATLEMSNQATGTILGSADSDTKTRTFDPTAARLPRIFKLCY